MFSLEEYVQIQKGLEIRIKAMEDHIDLIRSWDNPDPIELGLLADFQESIKAAHSAIKKIDKVLGR
jgi:hypothetical protein